jgi:hypothetical protein
MVVAWLPSGATARGVARAGCAEWPWGSDACVLCAWFAVSQAWVGCSPTWTPAAWRLAPRCCACRAPPRSRGSRWGRLLLSLALRLQNPERAGPVPVGRGRAWVTCVAGKSEAMCGAGFARRADLGGLDAGPGRRAGRRRGRGRRRAVHQQWRGRARGQLRGGGGGRRRGRRGARGGGTRAGGAAAPVSASRALAAASPSPLARGTVPPLGAAPSPCRPSALASCTPARHRCSR